MNREPLNRELRIPILALSAAVMEDDRRRAKEAGMDGHVAKPIDSGELYAVLGRFLEQRGTVDQEAESAGMELVEVSLAGLSLDGFDLERGLGVLAGNIPFYLKILHGFKQQLDEDFSVLPDLLNEVDWQGRPEDPRRREAKRISHTLKGLAGTVGAIRLADAVKALDQALASGEPIAGDRRGDLCRETASALSQAREQLAKLPPLRDSPASVPEEEAAPAIQSLLASLRNSELVNDELLTTVTVFLGRHLGQERAAEFRRLVEEFDQDRAAEMLGEMVREMGMD